MLVYLRCFFMCHTFSMSILQPSLNCLLSKYGNMEKQEWKTPNEGLWHFGHIPVISQEESLSSSHSRAVSTWEWSFPVDPGGWGTEQLLEPTTSSFWVWNPERHQPAPLLSALSDFMALREEKGFWHRVLQQPPGLLCCSNQQLAEGAAPSAHGDVLWAEVDTSQKPSGCNWGNWKGISNAGWAEEVWLNHEV